MPAKFSVDREAKIIDLYNNGLNPKQIGLMFGTYNTSIRRVLLRKGIIPQSHSERRRLVKANPFIDLTCKETQYWLGYLAADGCVRSASSTINISTNLDPEHLNTYLEFLKYPIKVKKYFNKT